MGHMILAVSLLLLAGLGASYAFTTGDRFLGLYLVFGGLSLSFLFLTVAAFQ